jgi:peroxisomal membrane protein 2
MKALKILLAVFSFTSSRAFVFPRTESRPQPSQSPTTTSGRLTLGLGPAEAWQAYGTALESDPLIVKSITAAFLLGAGDLSGQLVEKKLRGSSSADVDDSLNTDWARAARFAFFGLVLQAPWNHAYYTWLDGAIPPTEEPFSTTNIIKVGIDQFIQAPIFTVLIFAFLGVLEGKTVDSIQLQLKNDYKDTIVANCKIMHGQLALGSVCAD